jgi:hypothetical protein
VHAENLAEWMRSQLEAPQALFTVAELATLSGLSTQRVRRFLIDKRLIAKGENVRGQSHQVEATSLIETAPAFWKAIVKRIERRTEPKP